MYFVDFLNCLQFHNDFIIDEQINNIVTNQMSIIVNLDRLLNNYS